MVEFCSCIALVCSSSVRYLIVNETLEIVSVNILGSLQDGLNNCYLFAFF